MPETPLSDLYLAYIDCLNRRDWDHLGRHVAEDVEHNGRPLGVSGYRAMLEKDVAGIPDLFFRVDFLVCEPPYVAARILFDCTPNGEFLGLRIDGRRISFTENVFYEFREGRIVSVWSIVDKAAVEEQIRA